MKKPSVSKNATTPAKTRPDSFISLLTEVGQLILSKQRGVSTAVNGLSNETLLSITCS
jgi:hypothetical protein